MIFMAVVLFPTVAVVATLARVFTTGKLDSSHFPWGTFLVNVAGSFALGLLAGSGSLLATTLGVGGLGSLTTFSGLAHDVARRCRSRAYLSSVIYLGATVIFGVLAAWFGIQIAS